MLSDDWRRQMLSEDEQEEITKDLYRYFENNVEDFGHIVGWCFFDVGCNIIQVVYKTKSTNETASKHVQRDWLKE